MKFNVMIKSRNEIVELDGIGNLKGWLQMRLHQKNLPLSDLIILDRKHNPLNEERQQVLSDTIVIRWKRNDPSGYISYRSFILEGILN